MRREEFGKLDLSQIMPFWIEVNKIRSALDQTDQFHSMQPASTITARRVDEDGTAGRRPYFAARGLLAVALDHHDALPCLLDSPLGLTPFVPWTLLRSVFETSVWAIWILEPRASKLRRIRGLRREWLDHQEHRSYQVAGLTGSPRALLRAEKQAYEDTTNLYLAEVDGLGLDVDKFQKWSFNMVDELKQLATIKSWSTGQAHMLEVVWRGMSGHAHGYAYAAQSTSEVQRQSSVPGGIETMMTVDGEFFASHAITVSSLLRSAMQLYISRSTEPAV